MFVKIGVKAKKGKASESALKEYIDMFREGLEKSSVEQGVNPDAVEVSLVETDFGYAIQMEVKTLPNIPVKLFMKTVPSFKSAIEEGIRGLKEFMKECGIDCEVMLL